jgi:hypothetical protein
MAGSLARVAAMTQDVMGGGPSSHRRSLPSCTRKANWAPSARRQCGRSGFHLSQQRDTRSLNLRDGLLDGLRGQARQICAHLHPAQEIRRLRT